MAGKGKRDAAPVIVIKRYEEGGHGHHGGAWKVAYADFVTAMMAFFLLMWLLNATSEEQRRGLADYFAPTNVLGRNSTGSGQPFGGRTPNSLGEMTSDSGAMRVERGPAPMRIDIEEEEGEAPNQPGPTDAIATAALPGRRGAAAALGRPGHQPWPAWRHPA
ncbi:hypothetical protein GCM10011504_15680 [Siccirubricoccus deserti]|uniref:Motility protein B-like N-terminal domain-containing protein n=1 Tax=Siccirubricoccus deserti TaxID=2013562 RepID=A0A9X0QXQ2_9PROT|nr:flagellar motor protein MotB [Siccirubricoccus deserti]MBC4015203.1 hypothetical protein [Siccirubricoccus deserti]GGC38177.1 hypothetical protein GCM10011504_15680 [Siccirubricoccus deserti]